MKTLVGLLLYIMLIPVGLYGYGITANYFDSEYYGALGMFAAYFYYFQIIKYLHTKL